MLRSIREWVQNGACQPKTTFQFAYTTLWDRFVREQQAELEALVFEEMKLEPSLFRQLEERVVAALDSPGQDKVISELMKSEKYDIMAQRAHRKRVLRKQNPELSPGCVQMTADDLLRWLFEVRLGGWPESLCEFLKKRA
jgi:hypothetical protein